MWMSSIRRRGSPWRGIWIIALIKGAVTNAIRFPVFGGIKRLLHKTGLHSLYGLMLKPEERQLGRKIAAPLLALFLTLPHGTPHTL